MGASPRALLSVRAMLLWLVLACLLPALLGTGFMLQRDYQKGRAQQDAEMLLVAQALLKAVDTQLDVNRKVAQSLALAPELLRGDLEGFHRKASALLPKLDFGSNIVVSDRSGQMLINTGKPWGAALPINSDVAKIKTVFETAEPWIGGMFLGTIDGKYKFQTLAPVITNDRVSLVVSVSNQSEQMSRILQNKQLPPAWLGVILDSQGNIAGRSQEAEAYVGRKAADRWLRAGTSNQGSFDANTLAGIESRIAFSRSPATKWTVGLAIPLENLEAPLWRSLTELSLSALAMLGLALAMAWLLAGKIARSVNSLLAPAQALAEGKALAVSKVHFKEAEFVAMAMARAASLLQKRTSEVAARGKMLKQSESSYRELVDVSPDAIVVSDEGLLVYVNATSLTMFGAKLATELIGNRSADFVHPDSISDLRKCKLNLADQAGFSSSVSAKFLKLNGDSIDVEVRSRAMLYNGKPAIQSVIRDVTERNLSKDMAHLALHDALTGLPNRRQLQTRIEHALAVSKRQQSQGAVLFFDLDHFKAVNDAWGHAAGDDLLQRLALRISERMRDTDLLARLGGDEFVLLLENLEGPGGAAVVASDVLRLLSQPFMLAGGQQVTISCSIGIAMFPADGRNFTELMAHADAAQYRAKAEGRKRFRFHAAARAT